MIRKCSQCCDELGPWEGRLCLGCQNRGPNWKWSASDLAVLVLEREPAPLTPYDICRVVLRDYQRDIPESMLNFDLAQDKRFCWAGQSIYGLFRHGLVAGPRNLGETGCFFMAAFAQALDIDCFAFALKSAGYRFQTQSLRAAMKKHHSIQWLDRSRCEVPLTGALRHYFEGMGVAEDGASLDDMIRRFGPVIGKGAIEFYQRSIQALRSASEVEP
jgi:hypothetical protein